MRYLLNEPFLRPPVLVEGEFSRNLNEAKVLFVGSSIDMFAKDIPDEWITKILDHCASFNEDKPEGGHIVFLLQSKDPARILQFAHHPIMDHAIVATTLETNRYDSNIMGNSPKITDRALAMEQMADMGIYTMVTAEPLMDFDLDEFVDIIRRCNPRRVNIGKNSAKDYRVPEPNPKKVQDLVTSLRAFTRVEIKKNASIWFK
jgi:DNA repair photolyase